MRSLTLIEKAFLLKKTKPFGHLDLDLLLTVADRMTPADFDQGEMVFQEGQQGHRLYVMMDGQAVVAAGESDLTARLNRFDCFGDESLFNERPRAYSVRCETDVTVLSLSRSDLLAIIGELPSVALALLESYSCSVGFRLR